MNEIRFGDADTADVLLELVSFGSDEVIGPFKLHSKVLSQAQFFKAQLSERWVHDKPAKIYLRFCRNPVMYVKFFEMLYMPEEGRRFSSIEEALGILEIAAQLLCQECINCCMNYVEAVAWTSEQEEAIRACISSLDLVPSPDLALRLSSTFKASADEVEHMLHKLILSADRNSEARQACDIMLNNLQDGAFAVVVENLLLQDLHQQIQNLKRNISSPCSLPSPWSFEANLTWLLDHFQRLNIAGKGIQIFAEDTELPRLITCRSTKSNKSSFVNYLDKFFGLLYNGKVVLPRAVRMALVTSWFPVFVRNPLKDDWLAYVVKSLPMEDQHKIFNLWAEFGPSGCDRLNKAFLSWCSKLREGSEGDSGSSI